MGIHRYILVNDGVAAVLAFHARSVATHAFTATVTVHDAVGVIVNVYGHIHAHANALNAPLVTLTSVDMKLLHTLSLHDTLTDIAPLIFAGDVLLIVGTGTVGSYVILSFTCVLRFHAVSLYFTYTYLIHSVVVHHAHA